MTPLHLAVEKAHIEVVKYLVDQRADISIQDKEGVSICVIYSYKPLTVG